MHNSKPGRPGRQQERNGRYWPLFLRTRPLIAWTVMILSVSVSNLSAAEDIKTTPFIGQDLHLLGEELITHQPASGRHTLVFQRGFSMSIGANLLASDAAVVWLESVASEYRGRVRIDYDVKAYLQGSVSLKKGLAAKTTELSENVLEAGEALLVQFLVTGEVFVTAQKRIVDRPDGLELYQKAEAAAAGVRYEPRLAPKGVPELTPRKLVPETLPAEKRPPEKAAEMKPPEEAPKPGLMELLFPTRKITPQPVKAPEEKKPAFQYPVNIVGVGESRPRIESTKLPDGKDVASVIGRFYLWQKLDEKGNLLELQADRAVIYYIARQLSLKAEQAKSDDLLASGAVQAVYLAGDIVMTEGPRTIRADELYYDFQWRKALVLNAVMRSFDVSRGIPIYIRADKLRQLAQNKFTAEDVTLSSSEFYMPQMSLKASSVIITDTTGVDQQDEKLSDASYDAQIFDLESKLGDLTFFYWPYMRSNLERPDVPLKSAHTSYDSTWGLSIESRWYLSRLLGLQEPEGVDSTLAVDYFGKRGAGIGAEIEYEAEKYFGRLLGYIISDSGEDDLGRSSTRKDLKPPHQLRGRARFQHRHYLPYNWQLTLESSFTSDRNFLESFYRGEYDVGKEQETIAHLKRLQDNWALSFLGKWRINDFVDKLEELPTAEFHLIGQSLFNDKFTFYSENRVSRLRQRLSSDSTRTVPQDFFSFMVTRNELDMPIKVGNAKLVPFIAGTIAYEDQLGFISKLNGDTAEAEKTVWLGEAGLRFSSQYWKVYPDVNSPLWDLNGIRHIIKPQLEAVFFAESDSVAKQRDTVSFSLLQRWQTKRGPKDRQHVVDWMRLNTEVTWVNDSGDSSAGPDRFIWNEPFIPMDVRRNSDVFGPRRNYFATEYIWRISDTTAFLSDLNFDMQSGVVQQFNVGLARYRWPNLSYYIGSRYLRRVEVQDEKGSNAVTLSASYALNPRYTVILAQEYDFDYGVNVKTDITLLRRYHRIYCGLTFTADQSLDRQAIIFSIWPEGVSELAVGSRRYVGLGGKDSYE